jgi:hypothetical protein
MENRRILKFRTWPPLAKGLVYGGLAGCALTVLLHVLNLWLAYGDGIEAVGVLVGYTWQILINNPTAALCQLLDAEWDLGPDSKPSPAQFLLMLAVNSIICSVLGALLALIKHAGVAAHRIWKSTESAL